MYSPVEGRSRQERPRQQIFPGLFEHFSRAPCARMVTLRRAAPARGSREYQTASSPSCLPSTFTIVGLISTVCLRVSRRWRRHPRRSSGKSRLRRSQTHSLAAYRFEHIVQELISSGVLNSVTRRFRSNTGSPNFTIG